MTQQTRRCRYAALETDRRTVLRQKRCEHAALHLDNFETNLLAHADTHGYACEDPEWDRLLADLARQFLPTASCLLLTTRHRPLALNRENHQQPLAIHLGINSGLALVGSTRFEALRGPRWTFTASGPVTNLAAGFVLTPIGPRVLKNLEAVDVYRLVRAK